MGDPSLHFDGTIRAGDLISLIGFLIVGLGAYYNIKGTLRLFGFRLDIIDASIEDLKVETKNGSLQDADINRLKEDTGLLRKQVFNLQMGKGLIVEKE